MFPGTEHLKGDRETGELDALKGREFDVVVIGGGDTGTDCVGTAMRQGCRSLTQFEIMPKPPVGGMPPSESKHTVIASAAAANEQQRTTRSARTPDVLFHLIMVCCLQKS